MSIASSSDAILIRRPIRFLNDMLKQGSLDSMVLGVIISASFIDSYGQHRLEEYFKQKEIPVEPFNFDNVRSPRLGQIIDWLWDFKIINEKEPHIKGFMNEVEEERNIVVHHLKYPEKAFFTL